MAESTGKRPFWMHQMVEYILGGGLVASGLQSPTPIVPAVLGGFLLMYAAGTRGALSAFRLIDRRWHRVLDPVIVLLVLVAAAQPWVSVDNGTRVIIAGIALVHLVVWLGSSYTEKVKAPKRSAGTAATGTPTAAQPTDTAASSPGDRSSDFGRSAGRLVGSGVKAVRKARAKREQR